MNRTIRSESNAALQEFGGIIPAELLAFEDARREFLYVRQLELQKLGIAPSNKTVTSSILDVSTREGTLELADDNCDTEPWAIDVAFVEFQPTGGTIDERIKVTIVGVEDITNYEGARAISFYGNPLKYRLSWDSWDHGTLYLYYDPVEDIETLTDLSDCGNENAITFPLQFWQLLSKKTAFNLIDVIRLKLAFHQRPEEKEQTDLINNALTKMEQKLALRIAELDREWRRYINRDLNQQTYMRRSIIEMSARRANDASLAFGGWE